MYLVIATACGPMLCCCAPGRSAATLSRLVTSETSSANRSPVRVCCGHGADAPKGQRPVAPGVQQPLEKPGVPAKSCPCHERCAAAAAVTPESRAEALFERSSPDALVALGLVGYVTVPSQADLSHHQRGRSTASLFKSLRAPHVLRC